MSTRPRRDGAALALALLIGLPVLGVTAAAADPPPQDWATLRACESSGRYGVVASHGHYGAYQFDLPTWRSVGGTGLPSDATRAEQDYRALYLYRMRGWQPWECARLRGLAPDADARTGRAPDRAESAYMAPDARPADPGDVVPDWPGVVYTYGDCAPELRTWQLRMNPHGYDFAGTGCYQEKTRQAVLDLQRKGGLDTPARSAREPGGRRGPHPDRVPLARCQPGVVVCWLALLLGRVAHMRAGLSRAHPAGRIDQSHAHAPAVPAGPCPVVLVAASSPRVTVPASASASASAVAGAAVRVEGCST